ncbi:TonB-dependent receptor [Pseudomonas sp. P1B16]|uniref:TonB-dependent receptor domain-containing protein n=1 Tax=Pseudomonas sp. P1B16 TaxID=2986074 RepID=UPI002A2430DD|nr:TonB-dependent receptor [Pseudomonas sp. P1B16]WPM29259.1 TonB-dependent receptor [Pseudomonas sp. P1B16]
MDRRVQRRRLQQRHTQPVQHWPHPQWRQPLREPGRPGRRDTGVGQGPQGQFRRRPAGNGVPGGTSVEANWTLPNDFTLTSITAYRWWDFTPRNDDGLDVPVFYSAGVSVRDKQYSQEIRLASPTGGAFDYVLGAYYFKQDLDNTSFTYYGPQADTWNLTPAGALNNVNTLGDGHIDTDSYALFAQGTWHVTDRLDFTAGIRGTYEEKSAWVTRDAPTGGAAVTGAAAAARQGRVGAYDSGDLNQYSFSPSGLLGLSYRFNDQVLGYATLTHGEKSVVST